MLLMAPVAFLRCMLFWGALLTYGARRDDAHAHACVPSLTAPLAMPPGLCVDLMDRVMDAEPRRRHALLLPPTRLSVRIVMGLCGYTVRLLALTSQPASALCGALTSCVRLRTFAERSSASRATPTCWRRSAPLQPLTPPSSSCVIAVLPAAHAFSKTLF
jgi:hypothetical protein